MTKLSQNNFINILVDAYVSSLQFHSRLASLFIDAVFMPFIDANKELRELREDFRLMPFYSNQQGQQLYYKKVEKIIMSKIRNRFDKNYREEGFVSSLFDFIDGNSRLGDITGYGQMYQQISNFNSFWNNAFIEPLRDKVWRTPSHRIYSENKYSLFHYDSPRPTEKISTSNDEQTKKTMEKSDSLKTPLLIIYAFINRHYILDLMPDSSIVRNLQRQGFDIFAADWGTPSAYDKELTIGHYVNNYLANAIDHIRKHSNSDIVSLLGYCWGGDLALMLAALYPEKVKNVIALTTPGDFSLDNNLVALWTKNVDPDTIVDTFGNVPSAFINSAFLLRNPIDYLHKYPHFFFERTEPIDFKSAAEFFATEMWLYDSPPVIGEIYRQFVKDCYQKNLLIKNEMIIGGSRNNTPIDLSKIKVPFVQIIASKDDLVAPASSRALNDVIGSADKSIIEFDSGHVGACIGSRAHKELWPKVGKWLRERS